MGSRFINWGAHLLLGKNAAKIESPQAIWVQSHRLKWIHTAWWQSEAGGRTKPSPASYFHG